MLFIYSLCLSISAEETVLFFSDISNYLFDIKIGFGYKYSNYNIIIYFKAFVKFNKVKIRLYFIKNKNKKPSDIRSVFY